MPHLSSTGKNKLLIVSLTLFSLSLLRFWNYIVFSSVSFHSYDSLSTQLWSNMKRPLKNLEVAHLLIRFHLLASDACLLRSLYIYIYNFFFFSKYFHLFSKSFFIYYYLTKYFHFEKGTGDILYLVFGIFYGYINMLFGIVNLSLALTFTYFILSFWYLT